MQYEVLSHRDATWRVGETKAERVDRTRVHAPVAVEQRYPETYPGRVISVRAVADVESGKLPSLRKMSDRDHPVVVLDLDTAGRAALSSRLQKVVGGRPEPVTFDDRWGAVAPTLRKQFDKPEDIEAYLKAHLFWSWLHIEGHSLNIPVALL